MDEETVEIYWLETKSMLNANASKSTTFKTCTTNDLQKFKQKACVNNMAEGPNKQKTKWECTNNFLGILTRTREPVAGMPSKKHRNLSRLLVFNKPDTLYEPI